MAHWNSSPHPISDIRDWSETRRLELRPDFQRREVWSAPARIMLMDTILRDIPMPKIFLANTIRDGKTYRVVIDGQQRITAILSFLRDEFSLTTPYSSQEYGKYFSELDKDTQERFLSYQIDFNEALNPSDEETREVYARINKYTVPLTKQELRRADFPGDFLDISEKLSVHPDFEIMGLFTTANRRRYADVEYVSELLAAMIDGIQDKKADLDNFYIDYADWDEKGKNKIKKKFFQVLKEIRLISSCMDSDISETRFRQRADFYTLFTAINELISEGYSVEQKDVKPIGDDLQIFHEQIRPESEIDICSEYAIKCVSQANSASSRRWRHRFIRSILTGTYIGEPDEYAAKLFYEMEDYFSADQSGLCPDPVFCCPVCDGEITGDMSRCVLAWPNSDPIKQISNVKWAHRSCVRGKRDWFILKRSKNQMH